MSEVFDAKSQRGSTLLAEIRRKYPGYHPIVAIVDIAHHQDSTLELQYNCHKVVSKYVEPELKSVEVKQELKTVTTVRVSMFDEVQDVEYIEATPEPVELPTTSISDILKDW